MQRKGSYGGIPRMGCQPTFLTRGPLKSSGRVPENTPEQSAALLTIEARSGFEECNGKNESELTQIPP